MAIGETFKERKSNIRKPINQDIGTEDDKKGGLNEKCHLLMYPTNYF
jgi:hypothetical protein